MKGFYVVLAVVALVGSAVIGYVATSGPPSVVMLPPDLAPGEVSGYVRGSPNAPIEIVEFADFECPACGHFAVVHEPDVMNRIVASGQARFRFMDFPLEMHPHALSAHVAAGCADEQGKFWEMHDRLFAGQNDWRTQNTSNPKRILEGYASELGLDVGAWESCYDEMRPLPNIIANRDEAMRLGASGTPTFRIGNRLIKNNLSYDEIRAYVDSAIAELPDSVRARLARGGGN
jgi:protein-disulfide isomerase